MNNIVGAAQGVLTGYTGYRIVKNTANPDKTIYAVQQRGSYCSGYPGEHWTTKTTFDNIEDARQCVKYLSTGLGKHEEIVY